jgi:hypothetical protein
MVLIAKIYQDDVVKYISGKSRHLSMMPYGENDIVRLNSYIYRALRNIHGLSAWIKRSARAS